MNATLKKVSAEFLGTFIFLLASAGASASQSTLKQLSIALALGLAILTLGGISGGHFNPAVSIYFFARKELSFPELLAYVAAQLTAAFFGVVSGLGLWGGTISPLSSGNAVNSPVFLGEVVATAGLVFIIGTLVNKKQTNLIWVGVAAWYFAAGTFTVTASMANPAVTFGLMFNGLSTGSAASLVVAQLVGLAAAILVLMITGAAVAKKAPAKKASIKFAPAPIVTTTAAKKPVAKKPAAKKPAAKKAPVKTTAAKKPAAKKAPAKK